MVREFVLDPYSSMALILVQDAGSDAYRSHLASDVRVFLSTFFGH